MRRPSPALTALLLTACGGAAAPVAAPVGSASAPPPAGAPPAAPAPLESGRLPPGVRPTRTALALRIDPAEPEFSGTARLELQVDRALAALVIHGRALAVDRATVTQGARTLAARATPRLAHGGTEPEELLLTLDGALAAGPATLVIDYRGRLDHDLVGAYRVRSGDHFDVFTQLEPTDARRVYPGFDEPGFKVPLQLSIEAPDGLVALANQPLTRAVPAGGGRTRFEFSETPPLPSYLLAFAVGRLSVLEGPRSPVPVRVVATHGRAEQGALAAGVAAEQLAALSTWFGIPYPYAKLDLVAVPSFGAGAMENAGFVTFREEFVLLGADAAVSRRRALTEILAHELAHQWFGNLVTMAWWDDLWLNEAFATWMEGELLSTTPLGATAREEAVMSRSRVMDADALPSSRRIRQPVTTTAEALEAFDGVTYVKGAAVIEMVRAWLGAEAFQAGVRRYLDQHRGGNATAEDLYGALAAASGKEVAPVFRSFTDQAGVPEVSLRCDAARGVLVATQRAYAPIGVPRRTDSPLWNIPLRVRLVNDRTSVVVSGTLSTAEGELPLGGAPAGASTASPPAPACPRFAWANADESGYLRVALDAEQLAAARAVLARLGSVERVGLLGAAWASVQSGALGPAAVAPLAEALLADPHRVVAEQAAQVLEELVELTTDATREALTRRLVRAVLPRARALGFAPRPGEGEEAALLRTTLLGALVRHAPTEPWVRREAAAVARRWLAGERVDPELLRVALPAHAASADAAFDAAVKRRLAASATPEERLLCLGALAGVEGAGRVKQSLDLLLTGALRSQDLPYLMRPFLARRSTRHLAVLWLEQYWPAVQQALPPPALARLAWVPAAFCERSRVEWAAELLEQRLAGVEGAARDLAQAREEGTRCAALAEHHAQDLARLAESR